MRSVRKVLMTADTVGGVWIYALELIAALRPFGVEVLLATMGRRASIEQRREALNLDNLILRESDYLLEWMDEPWEDVDEAGKWLLSLEEEWSPDIVHLNGYSHGALPWRAPVVVVAHSCVLSWWLAVRGEPAPPCWTHYQRRVAAGLVAANAIVAPTAAMLGNIHRHYAGVKQGQVIANGRSSRHLRPEPKEQYVLAAGRIWDEAKNLNALARLAPSLPWPVYIAGDETYTGRAAQIPANVTRLGTLSSHDLASWLRRAAIYALPARYEPFGLSVLEAAFAGCTLVLGDIPSLRENWEGAAVFVNPEDDEEIASSLLMVMGDEQLRLHMGEKAQRRAAQFSPRLMSEKYLHLYNELMET